MDVLFSFTGFCNLDVVIAELVKEYSSKKPYMHLLVLPTSQETKISDVLQIDSTILGLYRR